ncbi:MAG: hypothetical protein V9G14_14130 [Cypionkella sp.]
MSLPPRVWVTLSIAAGLALVIGANWQLACVGIPVATGLCRRTARSTRSETGMLKGHADA